ncbi:MAG: hypothetical protein PHQ59_01080 [Candidatus Daviesbacteria bacterium]|nr:hypothetical protein [Candidatus Daviesbacteria bacterium]
MTENQKEYTLCGKCINWEFAFPITKKHDGEPWGYCKKLYTKNGSPTNQTLATSNSSISSSNAWLETSEKFGCVLGQDSGKSIDWSKFANFTIPTLEEAIATFSQSRNSK